MDAQNDKDTIEIDLLEIVHELLNHWVVIVLSTVLTAIVALCWTMFFVTPQYESTSELYVLSKSTSITSLADIQIGSQLTNDYGVVITGRTVLDQVIDNLELNIDHRQLAQKIAIKNPSNTRILQITVTDVDPVVAKVIADETAKVASAFIAEKMGQDAPNIISYGYTDDDPVSPSLGKNTLVGALLGAFVSAAFVTVTYLINNTIKTPEDIERKLGLTLLGSLPLEEENGQHEKVAHRKKLFGRR